ncbi:unnamed protein product [Ilex paraguariensis]|uniref:Uncharacterized protein n=1 Tax=Ilex paraguariensis TaxID=185542 RepID=A0ABC8TV89_9AQUA
MNLRLSFGSKPDQLVIPSPVKDKPTVNGDRPIAEVGFKSQGSPPHQVKTFRDLGNIGETFFDSQPWLESDCEGDFFSVNGDFTPSRGNTPVHQSFSMGTPKRVNGVLSEERAPGSNLVLTPTEKKMKLGELFKARSQDDRDADEPNLLGNEKGANRKMEGKTPARDLPPKSINGTPYVSGANSVCGSERTPNGDLKSEEKPGRSAQCCLPRLRSSRSFSERKKKMSPTISVG